MRSLFFIALFSSLAFGDGETNTVSNPADLSALVSCVDALDARVARFETQVPYALRRWDKHLAVLSETAQSLRNNIEFLKNKTITDDKFQPFLVSNALVSCKEEGIRAESYLHGFERFLISATASLVVAVLLFIFLWVTGTGRKGRGAKNSPASDQPVSAKSRKAR